MPWYHRIAGFLQEAVAQLRATRRTNLALLTAAILEGRTLSISLLARAWYLQLPYCHHQRKKRLFRFLSNTGLDTMAVPTVLLGPICQAAQLRGVTPIMIDWSELGQGRNGPFAGVCYPGGDYPCSVGCPSPRSWTHPRTGWKSSCCVACFTTCPPPSGPC